MKVEFRAVFGCAAILVVIEDCFLTEKRLIGQNFPGGTAKHRKTFGILEDTYSHQ